MNEPSDEQFDAWLRRSQLQASARQPAALRSAVWRRIRESAEAESKRLWASALLEARCEPRLVTTLLAAGAAGIALSTLTGIMAGNFVGPGPALPGFESIRQPPELLRPPARDLF